MTIVSATQHLLASALAAVLTYATFLPGFLYPAAF